MIFVYNETGKLFKLVAKESEGKVNLDLVVGGWSAGHNITSTTNDEVKAALLDRFGAETTKNVTKKITRHYVRLHTGREVFDTKEMNFSVMDFKNRYDDKHSKHMLVLLLHRGSRFHIDQKHIVGKPVFDTNFSSNMIMVKVLIRLVEWKAANGKLKAYIENKKLGNKELRMIGVEFKRKDVSDNGKSNYYINTIYDKKFTGTVPTTKPSNLQSNKFQKKVSKTGERSVKKSYNKKPQQYKQGKDFFVNKSDGKHSTDNKHHSSKRVSYGVTKDGQISKTLRKNATHNNTNRRNKYKK